MRIVQQGMLFLSALLFSAASYSAAAPKLRYENTSPTIRVKIAKAQKNVQVRGMDLRPELVPLGKKVAYPGHRKIAFKCDEIKNLMSSKLKALPSERYLVASVGSPTGLVTWDKKSYRGKLLLASDDHQSCDVIQETDLESYISTLLDNEMNSKWPLEVLKAQAVAARTYAYHKIQSKQVKRTYGTESFYDIESSERHQVAGDFFDSNEKTDSATSETRGEILVTEDGELTSIFYHAKCGGKTLVPGQVWDHHVKAYKQVDCPYCHSRGKDAHKEWKKDITYAKFKKFVEWASKRNKLGITDFKQKMRVKKDHLRKDTLKIQIGERAFSIQKSLLRRYFGRVILPSNRFKLSGNNGRIRFTGRGNGHGVGMCQLGALTLGDKGKSYRDILAHYFPKHKLKKLY